MARASFDYNNEQIGKKLKKTGFIAFLIAVTMVTGTLFGLNMQDMNNEKEASYSSAQDNLINEAYDDDVLKIYDTATTDIADFLDSLELENDIEYFYVFYTCLNDGLFSENGKFKYADKNSNLIDNLDALGIDCIIDKNGNGATATCRNQDTLMQDVMEKSGYKAYSTTCFLTENKNEIDSDIKPNHQITVVQNDMGTLYYDITNGIVLDKYNSNYLSDESEDVYVVPMPEYSIEEQHYITNFNNENDVNYINYLINNDTKYLQNKEIDKYRDSGLEKLNNNKVLVNQFKDKYNTDVLQQLKNIKRA